LKHQRDKRLVLVGASIALTLAASAHADVQFNGFGQVVVGSTLNNNRVMNDRTLVPDYKGDPTFQSESLFALQVQAQLADKLSATAQMVADGAPTDRDSSGNFTHNDFTPKFSWAYATYQLTDGLFIRGGRQRLPLYHYSDYLQVGEAYPWIRPPVSVYSLPVSNYDGVSLNGAFAAGNWYMQPQLYFGQVQGEVFAEGVKSAIRLSNIAGAVFDATYDEWLEMRLSYVWGKLTSNGTAVAQIQDGMQQAAQLAAVGYPPGCVGIPPACFPADATAEAAYVDASRTLDLKDLTAQYHSAAISINKYNFLVDSEYIWVRTQGYAPREIAYYASLGYRFGKLTPVLVYGHADYRYGDTGTSQRMITDLQTAENTPIGQLLNTFAGMQGVPTLLQGAQMLVTGEHSIDDYYEAGLRYDLTRNTALKVDYTYYSSPIDPATNPAQHYQHSQLVSAGFVFTF
jgi:hypothetical protein